MNRLLFTAACAVVLSDLPASARVPCPPTTALGVVCVSGLVSDVQGGGPFNGGVYHVLRTISVPAGETLTIMPGTIVKVASSSGINVNGTLSVAGSGTVISASSMTATTSPSSAATSGRCRTSPATPRPTTPAATTWK